MLRRVRREVWPESSTSAVKIDPLFSRKFKGDYFCAAVNSFSKNKVNLLAGKLRSQTGPALATAGAPPGQPDPARSNRGRHGADAPRGADRRDDRLRSATRTRCWRPGRGACNERVGLRLRAPDPQPPCLERGFREFPRSTFRHHFAAREASRELSRGASLQQPPDTSGRFPPAARGAAGGAGGELAATRSSVSRIKVSNLGGNDVKRTDTRPSLPGSAPSTLQ
jgi:hypothetical protein